MKFYATLAASCACALFASILQAAEPGQTNPKPHTKDPLEKVQKRIQEEKAVLYDVREKREWKVGHLEQAELLPLSVLGKKLRKPDYVEKLKKQFPTDKPIYLHCKSGGRSVLAAEALRAELGQQYDFRPLKQGYEDLVKFGFEDADLKKEAEPKK